MDATDQPAARIRVEVSGEVQGVFFRVSVRDKARELGLTGWVANTDDGRVVIQAQGAADALDDLVAFTHSGPPLAEVHELSCVDLDPVTDEAGFEVR